MADRADPRRTDKRPASLLFGLAPSGVYQANQVTSVAGELLPHRFTLTALGLRTVLILPLMVFAVFQSAKSAPWHKQAARRPSEAVCFLWHFP